MNRFKVGQKVVSLISYEDDWGSLIEGETYEVLGLIQCRCSAAIDVGFSHPNVNERSCSECGVKFNGKTAWMVEKHFAPIEETSIEWVETLTKELEINQPQLEPA